MNASWKLLIYARFALFLLDFDVLFGFTFFLCFQLASVFNIPHFGVRLWFPVRHFRSSVHFGVRLWFPVRHFRSSVVEGLCNFMARIPDKIKSIDGSKETLKLAVKITDLWFVGTLNKSEQAKMVFVDSEGDQIHAVCKSDHLKSWKADLKENSTYVMHNFKVVKNDVSEHEYKLSFIGVTVVREADLHELPFKEFRFVEFANIVAGNFVAGLLVDIIGVVDQVVYRHVSSKNTRNEGFEVMVNNNFCLLYIFVMDVMFFLCCTGEILSCTLWENYCMQFLSYLNERGNDGPMAIILTHARIKDAQGSYPASVSNSFKASKLLINNPILEIQEFKERLLDLGVEVSPVLLPSDEASSQAEVKSISEINGISEDVVCVTVGTISKIVMDNHSWCYPACLQCHRKNDIQTGPFTCGCGKDNDQPVLRYRVEVMVTQNNESSKFCSGIDGDVYLNASPQALDRLLGHVLAFKVRIQSKFKNAVVVRYSNELDLINAALEMLADSEACSKIDPSNVDCNNATHAECQSLSVTTDHDPVAGFPLTPKKRMPSDELDDELGSSQISPAQLSSNKLTRHSDKMIASDSSESENSESTQGSDSNFMAAYEDCQSPTNQPIINTEGYSDLGDQLIQCRYCNAQIQYSGIQSHIVSGLSHMLDQHNSHAKSFRMARDRLAGDQTNNIKLQLIAARGKDGRVYNMPNVPKIVAFIVGDFHPGSKRDIIVETQNGELQRIHELHASYLPLQYPLLFPYGEDGYRADILHRSTSSSKKRKRNRLTMREWFAYRLQSRSNEAQTLLHSRKLFQQFIVEGYTMVESDKLSYIRNNQKKLRVGKYSSLQSSLDTGTAKGLTKGKRVILPSTFVGSPRYMDQLYFDGMAICNHVGFPNLFITLTCNPNWPEIHRLLSPLNLKPTDRPDIVSRIFRLKFEHMLSNLTKEFQKRGLPHVHLLLFLHPDNKYPSSTDIDEIISAEIPFHEDDPELYKLVENHMIHGPCGILQPNSPCMKEGKCSRFYPKQFQPQTILDSNSYPVYHRRNNGHSISKNGVIIDNKYVVPYNAKLLKIYQAHINIEWCNQSTSIKYLFKYINKGYDRVTTVMVSDNNQTAQNANIQNDELKEYQDCRKPVVERLYFHLPDQHNVLYEDHDDIDDVLSKPTISDSKFLAWMNTNKGTMTKPEEVWNQCWHWLADDIAYQYSKSTMNSDEQKTIYHRIIQAVNNNEGGMFFLYGFGGTGKTSIWRTLASSLRAENQIVIIVASSGITSLLLPGGRIAHSRFKIPYSVEIFAKYYQSSHEEPAQTFNLESVDEQETATFAKWILDIGDGIIGDENDGYATIQVPAHLLITQYDDPISAIVKSTFPDLDQHHNNPEFFKSKTILASTNETVEQINHYVLSFISGDHMEYLSSDSVDKSETSEDSYFQSITTEFLNSLNTSALPTHSIKLKIGSPIMLLRNLDQNQGLCNGTRFVVTKMEKHVIAAEIISGKNIGLTGQSLSMVGLYLPKPVFTHGQLYVALSRVNSAKGLKILIHDDEQKSMNSTTNTFIEIPPFYHEQWAPNYPQEVRFKYNGATYPIRVQQHRGKYFFTDGIVYVRADLKIYEFIIINFFACDDNTIFYLHFTPPLNQQTCGRPILHSRQHIWTTEITQCILGAPQPLEIPSQARKYLKECDNHLIILRKNAPPLQWDVVTLDRDIKDKTLTPCGYSLLSPYQLRQAPPTSLRLLLSHCPTSSSSSYHVGLFSNRHILTSLSVEDNVSERISVDAEAMAETIAKQCGVPNDDAVLEEATIVLSTMLTNSVEVHDNEGHALGIAVFNHIFSWINYSCSPNAGYRFVLSSSSHSREAKLGSAPHLQVKYSFFTYIHN
ncbi:Protein SET DOMAIN GROUP 41 [Glycine soja]